MLADRHEPFALAPSGPKPGGAWLQKAGPKGSQSGCPRVLGRTLALMRGLSNVHFRGKSRL